MKKICIFTSHYIPYLGGVESYTSHLAANLIQKGDKVVIVTSNDMHLKKYERIDGVPVLRMPCFNLLEGRFPVSKPGREFLKMHRTLTGQKFDLVIVQTRFYPHSLYGVWFAKMQNAKCILIDHGTSHMTIGSPIWDRIGSIYEHGITALLRCFCKDFYGVSQACCSWLTHFGIKPKGVLYNSVDPDEIKKAADASVRDFKKEYGLDDSASLICYTGRLVKEKGILNLIEGFEKIGDERNAVLMIAGDGEMWDEVQRKKTDRIIPLGRISLQEIGALLSQSDIFCLPTDYPEGFPTSVLEAAAADCFIVTTDRGGSKELIMDDTYGIIMTDNRPETIGRALQRALDDPEYRKMSVDNSKQRLLEMFTWEKTADKVHKL